MKAFIAKMEGVLKVYYKQFGKKKPKVLFKRITEIVLG